MWTVTPQTAQVSGDVQSDVHTDVHTADTVMMGLGLDGHSLTAQVVW